MFTGTILRLKAVIRRQARKITELQRTKLESAKYWEFCSKIHKDIGMPKPEAICCRYHEYSGMSYEEATGEVLHGEILGFVDAGQYIMVVIDNGSEEPVTRYMDEIKLERRVEA